MIVFPPADRVYLVAELSANHNGRIERAEELVRAAAAAGADAVKLQTYTADTMTILSDKPWFRIRGTQWEGRTLYDLYTEASMPWEWQPRLRALALDLGIECFSTPFDASSVDFLESMNVPCHKVPSFELVDIPLLKKIATTHKPVIMSVGMANLGEIDEAVRTLRDNGSGEIILLRCVSTYPALPEESNLRTIPHLATAFNCRAGLSDHTLGGATAVAAVSLGACLIEKHFTLSRTDGGPDGTFSMEPQEFAAMSRDIRIVEKALGSVCYGLTDAQQASVVFRRSLFVVKDICQGEPFTPDNVRCIRPGNGLPPRYLDVVLTRRAACSLAAGTPLAWDMLG